MTPSNPSVFQAALGVGTNVSNALRESRDTNAIESILSQAMQSEDPQVLQNSIGKILSQVSPERQQTAIQYLQNAYNNVQKKAEKQQAMQAAKEAGYTYGVPDVVAAQQVKDSAKSNRLAQYGLGGQDQNAAMNFPDTQGQTQPQNQQGQSVFQKLNDNQLVTLTGAPDREVSEPAKAELKRRDEERNLKEKKSESWTKFGMERAKKVLDKTEEIAQSLPIKQTSLKLLNDAISSEKLEWWSLDNLAELTGVEAFRSKEGSIFKTATKEYFLNNISRAGARPNQWIEQQIADMMTKIGRTTAANLSVSRALQNEVDLDEERVRLTEEVFNELRSEGKDVGELGPIVNKRLKDFAEKKQDELFNDLRAIKAIDTSEPQTFNKVAEGTKISQVMIRALYEAYDKDPSKAAKAARKLGYSIDE